MTCFGMESILMLMFSLEFNEQLGGWAQHGPDRTPVLDVYVDLSQYHWDVMGS